MTRYLLIANQTLGGAELERVLEDRIASGDAEFFVLVPATDAAVETDLWMPADPTFTLPPVLALAGRDALDEARERSERRLDTVIGHIRSLGGRATGRVGSHDPVEAVLALEDREEFEEVIVSTLPARLSRWLKMDLPSRVDRIVDVPVTVVEASPEETSSDATD